MPSAMPIDPYSSSQAIYGQAGTQAAQGGRDAQDGPRAGLTDRQALLNHYWTFYRCQNYEGRSTDWNGHPVASHLEHDAIARQGYTPPGFTDPFGSMLPLKFRKPTAPYYLAKIVVDRYNGLLFGDDRTPDVSCPGDQKTKDFLDAVIKAGRFWSAMLHARKFGGAMGSVGVGFCVRDGRPRFDVFDPRWSFPKFVDRETQTIESFEYRYLYPETFIDRETNESLEGWFWYRRLITDVSDTVWARVAFDDNEIEPAWAQWTSRSVDHNLGFCPVVWIQNMRVDDDVDGDPDCHGAFEHINAIDTLISQAHLGTTANCDPTLVVTSDADIPPLQKGSQNAIHLPEGSSADYLEMGGSGPDAAMKLADRLRDMVYEITACVPEPVTQGPTMTATEVVTRLGRMIDQANVLREQYGAGITKLMEIVLAVCKKTMAIQPLVMNNPDGTQTYRTVKGKLRLPPKINPATHEAEPVGPGPTDYVELEWPSYFEPTLADTSTAASAASAAVTAQVIDKETAAKFLSRYFPVGDVQAMLARMKAEQDALAAQFTAGGGGYETEPDDASAYEETAPEVPGG